MAAAPLEKEVVALAALPPAFVEPMEKDVGTSGPIADDEAKPANGLEDQTAFLPAKQVILVFLGLSVAVACSFLEQTIIATALPRIASDLKSGKESSWVATAYLLTSLAFTPIYARWSDVFGRKQVLMIALAIFWVASLACAVSQTMIQLIIFRAFQGVGGGGLITMVLIIVSDIVSLKDRGKYMGITEAVIALSNGIGPLLGGVFSQYTTWRFAFWINLPLAGAAIAVAYWLLPLKGVTGNLREKFFKIDYLGSGLTIVSSILVLLGLNWGGVSYPWASVQVLVPLLAGICVFAGFLVWEAKGARLPIIPVHIFRYKTVVGVFLCTISSSMTFFGLMFFIPQFLVLVRGYSYLKASVMTIPLLGPIAIFVVVSGQIVARTGHYRWMIIGGHAVWCVAQGLQSTIDLQSSDAKIVGVLLMAGIASGFTFQTELIAAQASVPRHEMAVVTGVRNFVRLLGSTLSLAFNGAIVNNALRSGVRPLSIAAETVEALLDDPTIINQSVFKATLTEAQRMGILHAYLKGFRVVFLLTVAWKATATVVAFFLIEHHELQRAEDKAFKQQGRDLLRKRKLGRNKDDALEAGDDAVGTNEKSAAVPAQPVASVHQQFSSHAVELHMMPSDVVAKPAASGEKGTVGSTPAEAVSR